MVEDEMVHAPFIAGRMIDEFMNLSKRKMKREYFYERECASYGSMVRANALPRYLTLRQLIVHPEMVGLPLKTNYQTFASTGSAV